MKKVLTTLASAALLLGLSLGTANAGSLWLDWMAYGNNTTVYARDGGLTLGGTFGTGAFQGTYVNSGTATSTSPTVGGPLFCLDVFHSFSGTPTSWSATPQIVPPDPAYPPPWNTHQAAWIYENYGKLVTFANTTDNKILAAGVQLALWEVSHEEKWFNNYNASNWNVWSSGKVGTSEFSASLDLNSGQGLKATQILTAVKNAGTWAEHATYYNPENKNGEYTKMQGFLGKYDATYEKTDVVPEPGSVLLLGLTLLGAAGLGWRKRRS